MRTPQRHESNLINDLIQCFKLLLKKRGSNSAEIITYIPKLLQLSYSIFSSKSASEIFLYLCEHEVTTAWLLQVQLLLPEATVYRALKQLHAFGVIKPILMLSHRRKTAKGGPRPTVWGIPNCSDDNVVKAVALHYRSKSPKYRAAEKVAQDILDNYILAQQLSEISYRTILIVIKEMRIPFAMPDIADLAAQYLRERGVKVWR